MQFIFDLDGTIIDSDHRYQKKDNGDIDLEYWLQHCYDRDKVFEDRLLPLAIKWKQIQDHDHVITVCTSRSACQNHLTEDFLIEAGLTPDYLLCRGPSGTDNRGDAQLKVELLRKHFEDNPWLSPSASIMFDDHPEVRRAVQSMLGIVCFNPDPHQWEIA